MRLNTLQPGSGAKRVRKRVGRGVGSGSGKTCGRGHKGQRSRAGGGSIRGFEGGQMPLQRRLPKYGFRSQKAKTRGEVRLDTLARLAGDAGSAIDMAAIKDHRLVDRRVRRVKVIGSGTLDVAIVLRGLAVTRGARTAIEAAGGQIED